MTKFRRAACLCLTGVMAATFAAGNLLAFAGSKGKELADEKYDSVEYTDVTGKVDLAPTRFRKAFPTAKR